MGTTYVLFTRSEHCRTLYPIQLAALYGHVLAAEREQNEVNQSLDHIEQQQRDLAATLDAYEKTAQEIFGGQGANLRSIDKGPADMERDKKYVFSSYVVAGLY